MPTIKKLPKAQSKRTYDNTTGRRKERHEIYDTFEWRRLRAAKFLSNPCCEQCEKEGRITPTEEIHHITSFMTVNDLLARQALAFDYNNLMALCGECHRRMHNGQDDDAEGGMGQNF